jgi:hypothetical protein
LNWPLNRSKVSQEKLIKIMKKEHSITQLIIDESGSMNSAKNYVLDTYQSIVKAMLNERIEYPELQQYIDVWTFSNDTDQVKQVMPFQQIAWDIDDIPTLSYQPNGGTPLYDAMGSASWF